MDYSVTHADDNEHIDTKKQSMQIENDIIDEPLKKTDKVLKWTKRATFLYFLIYVFLLIFSVKVDPTTISINNTWTQNFSAWFKAVFDDLNANGLGDALAGLFAPLAFLWLAATVFIQSNQLRSQQLELRAQRNEMEAQRHEMDETQELIEKQIAAAEAQTEATKQSSMSTQEQARLLSEQLKNEKRVQADKLIEEAFREILKPDGFLNIFYYYPNTKDNAEKEGSAKEKKYFLDEEKNQIKQETEYLEYVESRLSSLRKDFANNLVSSRSFHAWKEIIRFFEVLNEYIDVCSETKKIQYRHFVKRYNLIINDISSYIDRQR